MISKYIYYIDIYIYIYTEDQSDWRVEATRFFGSRLPASGATGQEPGTSSRQAAVLVVLTKACVVCQDPGGFTNQLLGTLGTTYKKDVENHWFP